MLYSLPPARRYRLAWAMLLIFAHFAAAAQPGWLPGFHSPGLNGRVAAALLQPNGDIIAGGEFTNAGGHPTADYVARWDGRAWQALGEGPGRFTHLTALLRLPNGNLLVAGVVLDSADVHTVVTRWDGRRWQPLGGSLAGIWAATLAVQPDGGILVGFAGQRRPEPGYQHGVLRWDGRVWQPLAANPEAANAGEASGSIINQLVVTPAGELVAAGIFPGGPYQTRTAARWTGTGWQLLGPPAQGYRSAETLALTPGGEVLAAGMLLDSQNRGGGYVARWDGHAWQELGSGLASKAERLVVAPSGEILVHRIAFTPPYNTRTTTIKRWDGTRWQPLLPGPAKEGSTQEALAIEAHGEVLIADPAFGLTRWAGHAWHPLAGPPTAGFPGVYPRNGIITALAAGPKRAIFLAGLFLADAGAQPGTTPAHTQVHRWDGRQRRVLGPDFVGQITALAVAPNGDVLAVGPFALANGPDSIRQIARWDGHRWQPLGPSLPITPQTIAVVPNGDVLAGGAFGISRWDGRRWQAQSLPASPEFSGSTTASAYVSALTVAPNGDILAGGRFAGPDAWHDVSIMRWDGHHWQAQPGSIEPFVTSLTVDRTGAVVVGTGSTSQVHSYSSDGGTVMRLDTASLTGWEYPPTRFDGYVKAVAIATNGDLIAGGSFSSINGTPAGFVVRRHNGVWLPLGGKGVNGVVHALEVAPNGDIVVGGEFTATGDSAQSLGLWGIYRDW